MADRTREVDIAAAWTEVSAAAALNMADGADYALDISAATDTVYWFETDAADEPTAGKIGHPWIPGSQRTGTDTRTYTKRAGIRFWMRCEGAATISATPTA